MEPDNQAPQNQPAQPDQSPVPHPSTPPPAPTNQKPAKGYGKRPVWQWVLIYLVIAIVVYGIIYVLFIHKGGSSGTSSGY